MVDLSVSLPANKYFIAFESMATGHSLTTTNPFSVDFFFEVNEMFHFTSDNKLVLLITVGPLLLVTIVAPPRIKSNI
jgi:hypothetical protein